MLNSSEEYKKAIVGDVRQIMVKAVVDISDPDIIYNGVSVSPEANYSKSNELHNKNVHNDFYYQSLEHNRWLLDGSGGFMPSNPSDATGEVGYVSEDISGAEGEFSPEIVAQINFSNVEVLQAFTIFFSENIVDGWPTDFTVEILSGGAVAHRAEYANNKARKIIGLGFTVNYPDGIKLTVSRWSHPGRRCRIVEIFPGLYEEWGNDNLVSLDVVQQGDVSAVSLPYGTATLKIDNSDKLFDPWNKEGLFRSIEDRQGVELYLAPKLSNGSAEYKGLGMFYQYSGGWATGDNGLTMSWRLVDILGLLANREFVPPAELPTTLGSWVEAVASQLGPNFSKRYIVPYSVIGTPVTALSAQNLVGKRCGDILRFACMVAGVWPRADANSGKILVEPLRENGGSMDLDNLTKYPTLKGNSHVAAIVFKLYDGAEEQSQFVVAGTSAASDKTINVDNPFVHSSAEALVAARQILSAYGGNQIETVGRGDPAAELGDVDSVVLSKSSAATGRRIHQTFSLKNGVLSGCKSTLLQAEGASLFEERELITESGLWTAPEGITRLRVIIGGGGSGGRMGYDGSDNAAGEDGAPGSGGKIWFDTIEINEGQSFEVYIGAGGPRNSPGEDTTFGIYSSAEGSVYPSGYAVASTGEVFGRSGVAAPLPNSSDGGAGGKGGSQGVEENGIYIAPGLGLPGTPGASGFVAVYWERTVNE